MLLESHVTPNKSLKKEHTNDSDSRFSERDRVALPFYQVSFGKQMLQNPFHCRGRALYGLMRRSLTWYEEQLVQIMKVLGGDSSALVVVVVEQEPVEGISPVSHTGAAGGRGTAVNHDR